MRICVCVCCVCVCEREREREREMNFSEISFVQDDFEEALNVLHVCQEDYHTAVKPD